ncbi:hypothetical protein ACFY4C_40470 [Actinomadura viridis]|uniref:hypothetical protein n=1 Tax=Actinomadura viridis TaxID=58110 RepID=UPI00368FF50D
MTIPRRCQACRDRPVAWTRPRVDFCYTCLPGGPFTPPPCARCGSTGAYYSAGVCELCHPASPQRPASCRDCLAWGVTRRGKFRCGACHSWRARYPIGTCIYCASVLPIDENSACRLCWRQATALRRPNKPLELAAANQYGQQLYIAGLFTQHGRRRKGRTRQQRHAPPPARPALAQHRQLILCDVPRDLSCVQFGWFAEPRDPALAHYLDHYIRDHAARHGWSSSPLNRARWAARVLLGIQDTPGALIRAVDVMLLSEARLPVEPMLTLLAEADLLDDDRTPAIDSWFHRQIAGLPEQMRAEMTTWYQVLTFGSKQPPRMKPKAPVTIRTRVLWAKPALQAWATAGHTSLREITKSDIEAVLPRTGTPRATMGEALRSIFKVLKARKVVFTDPARAFRIGRPENRDPQPANIAALRDALTSADPERSAPAALLAFHGLWSRELRGLQLTDVRDGRLHLADRTILLAQPVRDRLNSYLDHRNIRWPNTANLHFFINSRTAAHTRPVDRNWLNRRLGMSAQAIREDRILNEAHATGGDIRRLHDLFGLSPTSATRYTSVVDQPSEGTANAPP